MRAKGMYRLIGHNVEDLDGDSFLVGGSLHNEESAISYATSLVENNPCMEYIILKEVCVARVKKVMVEYFE